MTKAKPKKVVKVKDPIEVKEPIVSETPQVVKPTKVYEVPETKADYLAVYELLKKLGITRISQLENEIARL